MVAIVGGFGLGLFNTSAAVLGANAPTGNPTAGRSSERIYVNSATGNLILQDSDERLNAVGLDVALIRTYNSQGLLNDDNADNWRLGVYERVFGLTGAVNTAGSTVTKTFGDGADVVYSYDPTLGKYVAKDGDGANDTLTWNAGNASAPWTWTDGGARNTETYNGSGQLINSKDADGNTVTYAYTGSLLTSVTDASGQKTFLDYSGNNLTQIRVVTNGQTQTLTHYGYDAANRLITVTVDLSPEDNSIADGKTYVTTYNYDGTSTRVASVVQSDGTAISFTYQQQDGQYRLKSYVVTSAAGTTR